MKNNYSIAQRNQLVEEHLWCIDRVMRSNRTLIVAAHLDRDDVYQQLAVRLIKAVSGYDPDKGGLRQHIFAQLKYELLNCKSVCRLYGITGAPEALRGNIVSIGAIREDSPLYAQLAAA
jgi:DNA-directed RNA polymerase specialized sigma subunit